MKLADVTPLFIPGFGSSGDEHWQTRWQQKISSARRVEQDDWYKADRESWVEKIIQAANCAQKPLVIIAHSLGCIAFAHAAKNIEKNILGAFLVAPADGNREDLLKDDSHDFSPVPSSKFPFPSILVASRDDQYCDFEIAENFAKIWGSKFIDAGNSGHINIDSGHGPWPEGLLLMADFLKKL